jgi:hypothetical protein
MPWRPGTALHDLVEKQKHVYIDRQWNMRKERDIRTSDDIRACACLCNELRQAKIRSGTEHSPSQITLESRSFGIPSNWRADQSGSRYSEPQHTALVTCEDVVRITGRGPKSGSGWQTRITTADVLLVFDLKEPCIVGAPEGS